MEFGYDRALFAVRLEHRGAEALDADAAAVVWRAVGQLAAVGSDAEPGELAVLVDADALGGLAERVAGEAVELVLPLSSDAEDFRLGPGDDFGAYVERFGPSVVQVEVRWGPDVDPAAKKAQALELTRLATWLHETGRSLLLDLDVPGLDGLDAAGRTDAILKAVREVREVGIEVDLWALPGPRTADEAQAVAELVRDAGRDRVGVLVRDESTPEGDPMPSLRVAGAVDGYRGFVLGPSIWSDVVAQRRSAGLDDDAAATAIAERLRRAVTVARGRAGA
ncbi:2-deoxy-5-keto-D-gluconate 6-phosphate aldolase domain-containing protein [Egicoccus halophilus]|uniref:DUF2090 domain-containing protein n=1 Tax=Egicoccus halophilus TaxID=1670830 RepID=A0A8J3A7V0_9ACTN|nr:DUF2090 domain-containing protein [Egicoccus halophilus]GGI03359.1 hypothetical protein GCM10011354_03640 [Egicoccus halophilus]